jgi:hypothetical protein
MIVAIIIVATQGILVVIAQHREEADAEGIVVAATIEVVGMQVMVLGMEVVVLRM